MYIKKYIFLGLFLTLGQFCLQAESIEEPFATLILLLNDCGEGGEVEFRLNGDPNLYTYYWVHGATDLHLTGLAPGTYTLVVRDFYGCEQVFDIEIFIFENCAATHTITFGAKKCTFNVDVQVFNNVTGELYDNNLFSITWLDDPDAGFSRIIYQQEEGVVYSYFITPLGGDAQSCCSIENYFLIEGSESCYRRETKIIVNEFDGKKNSHGQFIELLVLGDHECGGLANISGYIIDDNNGRLIKGNNLIESFNYQELGIDEGHLIFLTNNNWEEVPNGSLIVIYEDSLGLEQLSLTDDPTDENGDGVYVLSADNTDYFISKTGIWDDTSHSLEYGGWYMFPSWQTINISNPADGIQVLSPEKVFNHGISTGQNIYANDIEFELKLGEGNAAAANCQFINTDFFNKEHFQCSFDEGQSATPGLPNSPQNEAIILSLLNCDSVINLSINTEGGNQGNHPDVDKKGAEESIKIYPNPFNEDFTISFNSFEEGKATLELYSISGSLVFSEDVSSFVGSNKKQFSFGKFFQPGMYFVQFTFSSGVIRREYLIHVRD